MFEIEHIHPILVHFVIAPLIISIIFDFFWIFKKEDYFQKFSWYNLNIAGTFGVLSIISGLMAEENVIFSEVSKEAFERHEEFAFIFIILLIIQVLWRIGLNGKYPRKLLHVYYMLLIASLFSVIYTGYLGGKLVFEYGIGVKSEKTSENNRSLPDSANAPKYQFIKPDTTIN
jgi:uncharacterized membrane protein